MKASQALREKTRQAGFALENPARSWLGALALTVTIGIAYFMAARFGQALRTTPEGVAFFWPAAGIAVGVLVKLGSNARLPVAIAVAFGSIASSLFIGRHAGLSIIFGLVNAGQALLTAWLIERWCGRAFKLNDVTQVMGFLAGSAVGAADRKSVV